MMKAYNSRVIDDHDDGRFQLFEESTTNDLRYLPPSIAALVLHIKRSSYQAGWVWGNSLTQNSPPSPESCGWTMYKENLYIQWKYNAIHVNLDDVVRTCGCRTDKRTKCKCAKSNVKCLTYCNF